MPSRQVLTIVGRLCLALVGLWAVEFFPGSQATGQSIATYDLTVTNTWTEANHESWADPLSSVHNPHFSHVGGGTHNSSLSIWENGGLSSPGFAFMQERGWIDHADPEIVDLKLEFEAHLASGNAYSFLNYTQHFAPETSTTLSLEVSSTHPLVSLVSMIGPSPDWFVGVSGLNMRDGNLWHDTITVDLFVYNGGTRSNDEGFLCCQNGPLESPQKVISLFTDTPNVGDPLRTALTSDQIGTFTFELQSVQSQPGDYDGDDDVDGNDFLAWQRNPSVGSMTEWQTHFGTVAASRATATTVPEPTTLCLALFGIGFLVLRNKNGLRLC